MYFIYLVSELIFILISILLGQSFGQFNQLCDFLREHRITCEELDMPKWTKKDCETILNIVTPVSAVLDSKCSNRYEALFQSKTLASFLVLKCVIAIIGTSCSIYVRK